jgi:hypothetical protein
MISGPVEVQLSLRDAGSPRSKAVQLGSAQSFRLVESVDEQVHELALTQGELDQALEALRRTLRGGGRRQLDRKQSALCAGRGSENGPSVASRPR